MCEAHRQLGITFERTVIERSGLSRIKTKSTAKIYRAQRLSARSAEMRCTNKSLRDAADRQGNHGPSPDIVDPISLAV